MLFEIIFFFLLFLKATFGSKECPIFCSIFPRPDDMLSGFKKQVGTHSDI